LRLSKFENLGALPSGQDLYMVCMITRKVESYKKAASNLWQLMNFFTDFQTHPRGQRPEGREGSGNR